MQIASTGYEMANIEVLTILNGKLRAVIAPSLGATLLAFQRITEVTAVDIFLNAERNYAKGRRGYMAMLPWTARMRNKSFPWDSTAGNFPKDAADPSKQFQVKADWSPHAIHGYGPKLPWKKAKQSENSIELCLDSREHSFIFPSDCLMKIVYTLEEETLKVYSSVENVGEMAMPVGGGSHPFIPKYVQGCIALPKLQFSAVRWYIPREDEPKEAMSAGPTESLPSGLNFKELRTPEEGWDVTMAGWNGVATALWEDAGIQLEVRDLSLSPTNLLHLWFAKEKGVWAFEPLVNLGDGFNIESRGFSSGTRILAPGEVSEFSHSFTARVI